MGIQIVLQGPVQSSGLSTQQVSPRGPVADQSLVSFSDLFLLEGNLQ